MLIIPIGIQCTCATFKNKIKKTETLPFDWMLSTPKFVYEMLVLLLEKNLDVEELVKNHFFICDKKANIKKKEYYYTCDNGFALYNSRYNVIFPHDTYNAETIDKYVRRFERLKNIIINSPDNLYFIYSSQSPLTKGNFKIDDNIVIKDVYFYLSQIYDLIGRFRNNYKIILFDSIQEEQINLLNENIVLCKLNSCNTWTTMITQMKKFKDIFLE